MASAQAPDAVVQRPVIAVVSPKGGTGKTTLAANLASELSTRIPSLLVDLSLYSADVEWVMGVNPVHRLNDVIREHADHLTASPEGMFHHRGDLAVLCGPESPLDADLLQIHEAIAVLRDLVSLPRATVIDTSPGVDELVLGAIEMATKVILTTSTDLPSVRAAQRLFRTMRELDLDRSRVGLVVHKSASDSGLTVDEIEQMLGMRALAVIPYSRLIARSISTGIPFVEGFPKSKLRCHYSNLADNILGISVPSRRRLFSWIPQ